MKNFFSFSLFLTLSCLFQSPAYGSGIVLRGLTRVGVAGLRQTGLWVTKKAQEDPQATAGALTGAYVGYRTSEKDSKMLGALAGAFVGGKLVKDHKLLQTMQAQLQANTVKVSAFEARVAAQCSALDAQLGALGRQVGQLGQRVTDAVGVLVKQRGSIVDQLKSQPSMPKSGLLSRLGWPKKAAAPASEPQIALFCWNN